MPVEFCVGNSAHPLLPPTLRHLPGLQIAGPDGIPNVNVNKLALIAVKEIVVAFVVPPRSSDTPPSLSCHWVLVTV